MSSGAPRPSVLIWDWDNTLVDAWEGVAAALNATFAAFGLPQWTVSEVRARVRTSLRDSFPVIFGNEWTRAQDIFYATLSEEHLAHVTPMPGAEQALFAGRNWPQALVSNKTGRYLRDEVVYLGWSPFFGAVVGAGDAEADKPDPAPIRLALRQLGHAPSPTVWYLGDTALDMQAARAAGVTGVLVGDAAHDGGVARAAPDLHIQNAADVATRLRAIAWS